MNLNIGLSAIQASQFAINTISHNLANASTEGYHRQDVLLDTRRSTIVDGKAAGAGVNVGQLRRIRNNITETAYTNSTSDLSRIDQSLMLESRIESILTVGDGSIQDALNGLFDEMSRLSANPGEISLRNSVLNQAGNLASRIRETSNQFVDIKNGVKQQIQLEVDTLNLEIEQLVGLQNQINATLDNRVPNDLLDKRDRLVNQIAERVDVQRFEFVQNNMGLGLAGSTVNIGMTPIRFETVTDASGDIQIQLEGGDRPVEFAGGRIAALLDVHNNMIGGFAGQVDTFAAELISQMDQLHAVGIGIDGPFKTLHGTRAVSDVDLPLDESAVFPIEAGELFVTITSPSGERQTTGISIDPATDSLRDVATKITTINNVQAVVDANTGKMSVIAQPGYHFDFTGRLENTPDLAGVAGTAIPSVVGDYTGDQNQTYTITAIGTGEIGKTAGLKVQVTDASGTVTDEIDVGDGYAAGDPLELGQGVSLELGVGDLVAGDNFEVVMVSNSDTAGILSAVGLNTFFSGNDAQSIDLDSRIKGNPDAIATSQSGDLADTDNLKGFIEMRNQFVNGKGATFENYLGELNSEIGFRVQASISVQSSLSDLKFQYASERDSVSGVDVNEELINLTQYQKTYEAAVQVVRSMEAMLDELFQMIR
ncbi:flagellar hook-associated protein FlgK [Mariniblastus sp.]|nr:flagellar hook-associated protein FlgK [Mariniblastus sp.]